MAARKKAQAPQVQAVQAQGASVGRRDAPGRTLFDPTPFAATAAVSAPADQAIPTGQLFGGYRADPPVRTGLPTMRMVGGMLPMLATPKEILGSFTALEGDRHIVHGGRAHSSGSGGSAEPTDPRAGESTNRAHRTDSVRNDMNWDPSASKQFTRRTHMPDPRLETDEELFARKAHEAVIRHDGAREQEKFVNPEGETTATEYRKTKIHEGDMVSGYTSGGNDWTQRGHRASWSHETYTRNDSVVVSDPNAHLTLAESIAKSGFQGIARLQDASPKEVIATKNRTRDYQGIDRTDDPTPQVLGAHHRLSIAQIKRPDQLVPVIYHKNLGAAKKDLTYPYD